jgi:hypothetical protein
MENLISSVSEYLSSGLNIAGSDFEISDIRSEILQTVIQLKPFHPGIPALILADRDESSGSIRFTPYHPIRERPDRQIMSYAIGKHLSNLADLKEIGGKLYSRSCLSYNPCELVHRNPVESRMGLWVHDCLTEDLDHHKSLNRHVSAQGLCISFDFGLAFSCRYYPPFYTFELGLSDEEIKNRQAFLIALLSDYANPAGAGESDMLAAVAGRFPLTSNASLCRYYLRNYKSLFPVRLRYGRFFDKIKSTGFEKKALSIIADSIGLNLKDILNWHQFSEGLAAITPKPMDLRGLNLSGIDLQNAFFRGADLREADLSGSNLSGADFRNADLRGACIYGTNLNDALTENARL